MCSVSAEGGWLQAAFVHSMVFPQSFWNYRQPPTDWSKPIRPWSNEWYRGTLQHQHCILWSAKPYVDENTIEALHNREKAKHPCLLLWMEELTAWTDYIVSEWWELIDVHGTESSQPAQAVLCSFPYAICFVPCFSCFYYYDVVINLHFFFFHLNKGKMNGYKQLINYLLFYP